jgi:hypothetical protein
VDTIFKIISGVVLALSGFFSYFLYFAKYPDLRDFPWVNFPTILLGVGLALWGTWGLLKSESGLFAKIGGVLGSSLSLVCLGLFSYYVFVLSATMPVSQTIPEIGNQAPGFSLLNQKGETVSLDALKGKQVVLAFYRGYW